MLLIISSSLIEPPTESLMFRYVTQKAKLDYNFDILIESPTDMIDMYYKYMREKGIFDYIDDIQPIYIKEKGLRLDSEYIIENTIIIKSINFQNAIAISNKLSYSA